MRGTFQPEQNIRPAPEGTVTVVLGLWLQPRPAVILVSRVRKFLEKVPIADREQVRRWKDWETLLRPIARCEQVTLAATQKPASFRLRLHGCGS